MTNSDETFMQMAIELAKTGQGTVEPNPMVGCILVRDGKVIGSGAHLMFGGPHAEINAIESVVGDRPELADSLPTAGATAYVTLEPCSHTGKTGPCCEALIQSQVTRVVIACQDPNPLVSGQGIQRLISAGIDVKTNVLNEPAANLIAPFEKGMLQKRPWMIGKWAMTLDGKIATATGDSQWISNKSSREIVHSIRRRVDGVMVGIGTALADNPMLNARPAGPRQQTRIVVDSQARIPLDSKLVTTLDVAPTLIAVGPAANPSKCQRLIERGCVVFQSMSDDPNTRLDELLLHLGQLNMTNVLVEGGSQILGSLLDLNQLDETHVFIGQKVLGGRDSLGPIGGAGHALMNAATKIDIQRVESIDGDVYIVGRTRS